jgi:dihydrofolate reductase
MAELSVTTFVTLDGVMQAPGARTEDESGEFTHGGWQVPLLDDDANAFVAESMAKAEAFLLGRRTYDIFVSYWPKVPDSSNPAARALNTLPKHVVSRTLNEVTWNGSELVRDVATEVPLLKNRYSKQIMVFGSGKLVRTLLDDDLVDELNLLIYPVVLGSGERLFTTGITPTAMKLGAQRVTKSGAIIATYKPNGTPTYGSFELPK